jgi:nondiscriminating glutamyl-tRNA synthetase
VMLNYLALLGWATTDSQQIFSAADRFQELVGKFELERCQKSPAVFDMEKLRWMNGVYIRQLGRDELLKRTWPYLVSAGLVGSSADEAFKSYVHSALCLEQEKLVVLSDAPALIDFFLEEKVRFDPLALDEVLKKEGVAAVLEDISQKFMAAPAFTAPATEQICRDYAKEKNIKTGQVFHPVRVAVSGRTKGPSLFHMLEVMGKDRVIQRVRLSIERIHH